MIEEIIESLGKVTGLNPLGIHIETPEAAEHGDYSTNVAMQNAPKKSSPRDYALELVDKLKDDKELQKVVDKIDVAGPGFINFWLKKDVLVDNLIQIVNLKDSYGKSHEKKGKRVVVEYTDPNPFKEFHIGHLISNVTGEAFCRLQEYCGAVVWRADYFGDVGIHVAKSIWGLQKKMEEDGISLSDLAKKDLLERVNYMGQAYALGTLSFEKDEVAKKEIERLNTLLYMVAQEMWKKEGKKAVINYDPEGKISKEEIDSVYDLYKTGRKWSLEYFETIYARLGTKFDGYYPESVVGEIGYKYVKENIGRVFQESEGAVIFPGEKFGLHTRVFINKHNLPTYETKELGLAPAKYEDFKYDESIIVVGKEIKEYFAVLIEALTQVNPELGKVTRAICTGMVNLPSGKMSSRFGNVVTVSSLLDELKKRVIEKMKNQNYSQSEMQQISEKVAVGALKYAFLKNSVGQDFIFDMDKALTLEGNSGPYLQYTYARTQSVLRKSEARNSKHETNSNVQNSNDSNVSNLGNWNLGNYLEIRNSKLEINAEELSLLRHFVHFPEIISMSAKNYSPNLLCNYLYDLAQKFNTFYNAHKIIGGENEDFRLTLTAATGQILKNGLYLLGIKAPEKM